MNNEPSEKDRVRIFGIDIDAVRMPQAVARIQDWVSSKDRHCHYVVTPNVDHTILFQHNARLRSAYADAGLVLADGMPVLLASRLLRRRLPCRVTGADLVPALFSAATFAQPLRVFLLGAGPGVAERAARNIHRRWPPVEVVGTNCPPLGFERDDHQNAAIVKAINAVRPDLVVVGLGAPKQELWVHQHHKQLDATVALCVGAAIDFLADEKPRAPLWMRSSGLEWLFRCATEPRRLIGRYARDAWLFPQLFWREWRHAGWPQAR